MRAKARWMHVSDEKGGVEVGGGQTRVFSRFSGHIPVCSQTYHGPQIRASESPGCSRKEGSFAISLGNVGETKREKEKKKRNVAKKVIRV